MSVFISRLHKLTVAAVVTAVLLSIWSMPVAYAAASVLPATGGTNISAGSFVNLSNALINESSASEIKLGSHTLTLPIGWQFDTGSPVTLQTNSMALSFASDTIYPSATSLTFTVNSESFAAPADVIISGLRVKANSGATSGILSHSGATITGVSGSTSFANLSLAGSGAVFAASSGSGRNYQHTPPTNTSITINGGDDLTSGREVVLTLRADNVESYLVSNNKNIHYSDAGFKPYTATTTWTLEPGAGVKDVYVMYRSPQDFYSDIVSDSITLAADGVVIDNTTSTLVATSTARADFNQDGLVNETDLNLLLSNWSTNNKLSIYDLNNDGQVSINDWNAVLAEWTGADQPIIATAPDAGLTITPHIFNLAAGNTVKATVSLSSATSDIYTVRAVLNYPANLLDVVSVDTGSALALNLGSDNNLTDRVKGVIIRTVGFPGGTTSGGQVMTVTFKAKTAGTGYVATNIGSVAMNAKGHNKFNGFIDTSSLFVFAPNIDTGHNQSLAGSTGDNQSAPDQTTDSSEGNDQITSTSTTDTSVASGDTSDRAGLLATIGNFLTAPAGYALEFIVLIIATTFAGRWYFSRSANVITSEEQLSRIIAAAAKETEDSES